MTMAATGGAVAAQEGGLGVDEDEDERDVELATISAIFPELSLDKQRPHTASLSLEVAPKDGFTLAFEAPPTLDLTAAKSNDGDRSRETGRNVEIRTLEYLPPLFLSVELPEGYPDAAPPICNVTAAHKWLPASVIARLEAAAALLWEEYARGQIVYAYIDFLQQEADNGFGLSQTPQLTLPCEFRAPLLANDARLRRLKFEEETFECGVCLEPKKGIACYRLRRCGHVFCVGCLQDFYNNAITEGDVGSIKCLAPDCGTAKDGGRRKRKRQHTLHPSELLDIPIEREQVQRYVDIKLKKKLESDKSTIYCPRSFCQAPARSAKYSKYLNTADLVDFPESDSEADSESDGPGDAAEPPEHRIENGVDQEAPPLPPGPLQNDHLATSIVPPDRLAICSKCEYAFCRVCQRSWHGDLLNCRPPPLTSQLSASDQASYDYIRLHTSPCPTCNSPCQKTHGCNHMQCFQCGTHFCYLCSSWLVSDNPYRHFNTSGTPCFMRLWELEEGDEAVAELGGAAQRGPAVFGGPRAAEQAAMFAAMLEDGPVVGAVDPRGGAGGGGPRGRDGRAHRNNDAWNAVGADAGRRGVDPGLQRFLEMAANDEEDGWDSDELDIAVEGWL